MTDPLQSKHKRENKTKNKIRREAKIMVVWFITIVDWVVRQTHFLVISNVLITLI